MLSEITVGSVSLHEMRRPAPKNGHAYIQGQVLEYG